MECKYCKKPFSPTRDWEKFCSPKCRTDWHYKGTQQARGTLWGAPKASHNTEALSKRLRLFIELNSRDRSEQTHCGYCGRELSGYRIGAFCSEACEKHFVFDKPRG